MSGPSPAEGAFSARIAHLRAQVAHLREAQAASDLLSTYAKVRTEVDEAQRRLDASVKARTVLEERGILVGWNSAFADGFMEEVRGLIAHSKQDVSDSDKMGHFQANVLRNRACNLADRADREMASIWASFALGQIPDLDEQVLSVLSQIGRQREVQRIRELYQRLRSSAESLPRSDTAISAFENDATCLRTGIERMPIPEDVRSFLLALPRGAPLKLLTESVQEWLEANSLTPNFRIYPARTTS